ncbi:hypothetical protein OJ997_22155 [Solirubrobacter phytolaccae]|uniref:Exo-alpha-sialidase n=1 Tax=Solirubrobacter phytolaccae TaxID=1404360 RepID=A0A9X3NAS8_9ACTN|nr:hypothetical protein [Solirubrobacter phytolaccae]MDA0183028.1 hypothetical protein [Solirubrobacter phytolaccae]
MLAASLLALAVAAPASAAGTWSAAAALNTAPNKDASTPTVATDATGTSTAVWVRSLDDSVGSAIVEVATRPAGGAWSAPQTLSTGTDQTASLPRVSAAADGTVAIIWLQSGIKDDPSAWATVRRPGQAWDEPTRLSAPEADEPQIAIRPDGRVIALWSIDWAEGTAVESASTRAGGGWNRTEALTEPGTWGSFPSLAVGADGTAVAAWVDYDDATGQPTANTAILPAGETTWDPEQTVSDPAEYGTFPAVTVADGTPTVVWQERTDNPRYARNQLFTSDLVAGEWTEAVALTAYDEQANHQDAVLTTDAAGNQTVAWLWTAYSGNPTAGEAATVDTMQVATRAAGTKTWSAPLSVATEPPNATLRHVALATRADGSSVLGWAGYVDAAKRNKLIRVAVREGFAGAWSEPATLSGPGGTSSSQMSWDIGLAAGPKELTAVWHANATSGLIGVQASTWVPAPPVVVEPEPTATPEPTPATPLPTVVPTATPGPPTPGTTVTPAPAKRTPIRLTARWAKGRLALSLTGLTKTSKLQVKVPGRTAALKATGTKITVAARYAKTGRKLTVRVTDASGRYVATRTVRVPRR